MTKKDDPIKYAHYLRRGNVFALGENYYEVHETQPVHGSLMSIKAVLISEVKPSSAKACVDLNAEFILDGQTIIDVIE